MSDVEAQKKARVRLVIADVDGTLVTQEKVLTPRAIEAVRKLHAAEILFAITSGRPPRGMKMLVDPLQLAEPIAGFNGGAVTTPDLKPVSVLLIPQAVAREALDLVTQHKLSVFLYSDLEWYVRDPHGPHVDREQKTVQFAPRSCPISIPCSAAW